MCCKKIIDLVMVFTVSAGAGLTGCATQPKPLYYWGSYQPQLYTYFKNEEGPQVQLAKLEETVQKATAEGTPLPPGFNAHMGLLYLQSGQAGKAQLAFQTEQVQFPESTAYMDFLLKKKTTAVGTPVVPFKAQAQTSGGAAK